MVYYDSYLLNDYKHRYHKVISILQLESNELIERSVGGTVGRVVVSAAGISESNNQSAH